MDMMDKADALPKYPQGLARRFGPAQQQKQDVIQGFGGMIRQQKTP